MPDAVIYRFGEDSTGRVIAVGLRATIWEQEGDGLRLVHQSTSPPRRGRAGYGDLLLRPRVSRPDLGGNADSLRSE